MFKPTIHHRTVVPARLGGNRGFFLFMGSGKRVLAHLYSVLGNAQCPSGRSGGDPTLHGTEKGMELHVGRRGSLGVKLWSEPPRKVVNATDPAVLPGG